MSDYHERKQARKDHYLKHVHGKKMNTCTACSGSGHYDRKGNPHCDSCNGTGKVKEK